MIYQRDGGPTRRLARTGSTGQSREYHDVAEVAAKRAVEGAATRDQAQFGVRNGSVDRASRKLVLRVRPDARHREDDHGPVGAAHVYQVAGPEVPQPEEDPQPSAGVNVAREDRSPDRAGRRAAGIPACHRGAGRYLERTVGVETKV